MVSTNKKVEYCIYSIKVWYVCRILLLKDKFYFLLAVYLTSENWYT